MRTELESALPRAYVAAYRLLRDRDASKDACQEAAARVLRAADRYDPAQPFYPWFYRVLKNHCLDRLKGRQRSTSALEEFSYATPNAIPETAEGQVIEHERARALNTALARLPEELREIIELRHFQDLTYDEIAAILACPPGTVMSRLYRARKTLRDLLRETGGFYEDGARDTTKDLKDSERTS